MLSAVAAIRSATVAAKEFRLARMPVATIQWLGVRPTTGSDLAFCGRILTVTDAPMFLERVDIGTAIMLEDGSSGPFTMVESLVPETEVDRNTAFEIYPVIRSYGRHAKPHDIVGIIRVTITSAPAGLPSMSDTKTIVASVRRGGNIANESTTYENKSPKRSVWKRMAQPWIDGWRGRSNARPGRARRDQAQTAEGDVGGEAVKR